MVECKPGYFPRCSYHESNTFLAIFVGSIQGCPGIVRVILDSKAASSLIMELDRNHNIHRAGPLEAIINLEVEIALGCPARL